MGVAFDPLDHAKDLVGFSYAELERISVQAIKAAVIEKRKDVRDSDFRDAVADDRRKRRSVDLKAFEAIRSKVRATIETRFDRAGLCLPAWIELVEGVC